MNEIEGGRQRTSGDTDRLLWVLIPYKIEQVGGGAGAQHRTQTRLGEV